MGIEFGSKGIEADDELHSTIDWLNKQDATAIQKWLLTLDNKRLASRILSLDDIFLSEHLHGRAMFELFKILTFAGTQIDWVKDHPHSATGILWHFEAII